MLKKIPIVAHPIALKDLLCSINLLFKKKAPRVKLRQVMSQFLPSKYIYFTNSGTSSFYIILKTLKSLKPQRQVILPAYTASCLIMAIKKAGLKPILCDISLDDFNMDVNLLTDAVSKQALCITGVHMFGIVNKGFRELKKRFPDVFVVEDCAQSMGSKIDGVFVGNLGDLSFFSFNRGKNLPTYGGGCIVTNSKDLTEKITKEGEGIKSLGFREEVLIAFKILALSLAVRPHVYGLFYPFLSIFKEEAPHKDFKIKKYTDFQAAVALALFKKIDEFSKKRYDNGMKLIKGLGDIEDIILPKISEDTHPAFNRLPVVFKDLKRREEIELNLWKAGIETSRMYYKPLHHILDLGYKKDDFPKATYFAEHLLTLPTHPLLTDNDLDKIIDTIRRTK